MAVGINDFKLRGHDDFLLDSTSLCHSSTPDESRLSRVGSRRWAFKPFKPFKPFQSSKCKNYSAGQSTINVRARFVAPVSGFTF
jgi:hypothetical protein